MKHKNFTLGGLSGGFCLGGGGGFVRRGFVGGICPEFFVLEPNVKKKHGMILSMAIQTCKLPKLALKMCLCISFVSEQHPDLVSRLHIQTRLMGNFGLNGGIPWLCNTDGTICFQCKEDIETVSHFLLDCPNIRDRICITILKC